MAPGRGCRTLSMHVRRRVQKNMLVYGRAAAAVRFECTKFCPHGFDALLLIPFSMFTIDSHGARALTTAVSRAVMMFCVPLGDVLREFSAVVIQNVKSWHRCSIPLWIIFDASAGAKELLEPKKNATWNACTAHCLSPKCGSAKCFVVIIN